FSSLVSMATLPTYDDNRQPAESLSKDTMASANAADEEAPVFNGVKVLDVHSHIHDISMTDRTQAPRLAYQFWHDLWFIQGHGAAKPVPSPIAPGRHSDRPGNRDEDFQAVAASLAKYLEARKIDAQIISPHPLQFHGWMEDENQFKSWIGYQNDLAFKIVQARPDMFL